MSPSTLHFHMEHLTLQSDGGIKVSARFHIWFPPDSSASLGLLPVAFTACYPSLSLSLPHQTVELKAAYEESAFWCRGVRELVYWWFDCSAVAVLSEDRKEAGLCTVSPSAGSLGPGQSVCLEVRIRPDAVGTGEKWGGGGTHTYIHTWLCHHTGFSLLRLI